MVRRSENCGAGGGVQVGHRCLVQCADKAFSRCQVKNFTYYIDVDEEAVFDHKIETREENEHDDRRKRTRSRIHSECHAKRNTTDSNY
jgi:hypothetical protein